MSDGKVVIDTAIDDSGIEKDMQQVEKTVVKSAKSQAAALAAQYRKQGMDASSAWKKAWNEIERTSESTTKKVNSNSKSMSDGAKKAAADVAVSGNENLLSLQGTLGRISGILVAAFSVKALVDFGKQAVEAASDLAEVQNVVDVAFGDMSYKMEEFANSAIEMYGISKLAAKKTGSTFMAMAKGMGLASDVASDMSIELTALSADMASFYNVSQDVASTALKSVFTGETETLKQYGIVMTETNLQEFAATQGIYKKISAMTQSEKVMLRYQYVAQQTALAQGDFARTSDSWANQTRILAERWREFMGLVGTGLTQVLAPLVQMLNRIVGALISAINAFNTFFGIGSQISDMTTDVSSNTGDMADNMEDIADATEDVASANNKAQKSANKMLGTYDKLSVIQQDMSDSDSGDSGDGGLAIPVGGMGAGAIKVQSQASAMTQEVSGFNSVLEEAFRLLSTIDLTNLVNAFNNLKDALQPLVDNLFQGLWWAYQNIFIPLAKWTIEDVLPAFLNILAEALRILNKVINKAKPVFKWLWDKFLEPIAKWTGDVIVGALQRFAQILKAIGNSETAVEVLTGLGLALATYFAVKKLSGIVATLKNLSSVLNGLSTMGKVAIAVTVAMVGFDIGIKLNEWLTGEKFEFDLSDYLGENFDLDEWLLAIKMTWDDFWGSFTWEEVWDGLVAIWDDIWGWLNDTVFQSVGEFFVWLWDVIKAPFIPVVDFFKDIFNDSWTAISDAFDSAVDFFIGIWDGISNAFSTTKQFFKDVFDGAWSAIKGIWNSVIGFFKNIWNGISSAFNTTKQFFGDVFNGAWGAIKGIWDSASGFFGGVWNGISSAFNTTKQFFGDVFSGAWDGIKSIWNGVSGFFKGVWNGITNTFGGVVNWFKDKFSAAWEAVKNVFSKGGKVFDGIKDGILNGLKAVVNALISGINKVISIPFEGINGALQGIKGVNILGVEPFGWLPSIDIPQIPYLATGAVIPANKQFLAMLGDQKHGTNIEAPLDTIKQALKEVMDDRGGDSGDIVVQVDGREIFRAVRKQDKQYQKSTGRSAFA